MINATGKLIYLTSRVLPPHLFDNVSGEQITVPRADQPGDIMIVISGGPGRHSVFAPTFVYGRTVTKDVEWG